MKPTEEVRCCWHCLWVTQFWKNLSAGLLLTQNSLGRGFIHHRVCLSNDRAPPELFPSLLASTRALTKNHQARQPAQGNKWASREIRTWPREASHREGKTLPIGKQGLQAMEDHSVYVPLGKTEQSSYSISWTSASWNKDHGPERARWKRGESKTLTPAVCWVPSPVPHLSNKNQYKPTVI